MMNSRICSIMLCLVLASTATAWADDFIATPTEVSRKDFLMKVKWDDRGLFDSLIAKWDRYSGKQEFKNKQVLRKQDAKICGVPFSVEARRYSADSTYEFMYLGKDTFPATFRETFIKDAMAKWGEPVKHIDCSFNLDDGRIDSHNFEWILNNTHIRFTYWGAWMGKNWVPGIALITVSQKGKYPFLKDLVILKCEGQSKLYGLDEPEGTKPVPPFILLIDPQHNCLLLEDKKPFGKTIEASDNYFITEGQNQKNRFTFKIDRRLGTYKSEVVPIGPDKKFGREEWGKCEKIEGRLEKIF